MYVDIRKTLRKYGLNPVKSLGQNFLSDNGILDSIVEAAELTKEDIVLEIGPGLGNLTAKLAEKAGLVAAVEIDRKLIPILNETLSGYSNVVILSGDIMRLDIDKELKAVTGNNAFSLMPESLKIVANLPYYITTPVVMKLLECKSIFKTMVFMVQKEVAERMIAKPGGKDYGALSLAIRYYSKPSIIMNVMPESFTPKPDVESAVVRLDIYKDPPVALYDTDTFFRIIKAAFGQRRKMLVNALSNAGYLSISKDQIKEVLGKAGINENERGEALSIEQFAKLSNYIYEMRNDVQ